MNEKNLEYLKDSLKYLGFGDKLYPSLENNVRQLFPEFVLQLNTAMKDQQLDTTLHFKKAQTSDMYFLNKYDASLSKENQPAVNQTFYINKGSTISLKEAYNLLNGRAVHKELYNNEGQSYKAWVQLDFKAKDEHGNHKMKQFHENYGFDLEATLKKYPIKELQDEGQREVFIRSLQRGNLQGVILLNETGKQTFLIEANPQFKAMNFYDANLKQLSREVVKGLEVNDPSNRQQMKESVRQRQANYKEVKEEQGTGLKEEPAANKKESKKNSNKPQQDDLLPKKRNSNKKGLSV